MRVATKLALVVVVLAYGCVVGNDWGLYYDSMAWDIWGPCEADDPEDDPEGFDEAYDNFADYAHWYVLVMQTRYDMSQRGEHPAYRIPHWVDPEDVQQAITRARNYCESAKRTRESFATGIASRWSDDVMQVLLDRFHQEIDDCRAQCELADGNLFWAPIRRRGFWPWKWATSKLLRI